MRASGVCLIVILAMAPLAAGSAESSRLDDEGNRDLNAQKYADALAKFRQAQELDPTDSMAVFLEGIALNRLSRFDEANVRLRRAADMGQQHPELAYELARSYVGVEQWKRAIPLLLRYDREHPSRAEAMLLIGRCYIGTGEYARARESIEEAVRRDPNSQEAAAGLLDMIPEPGATTRPRRRPNIPQSKTGLLLRHRLGLSGPLATGGVAPRKNWQISLTAAGGYDSNVTALGTPIIRGPGAPRKDSPFLRLSLEAEHDWSVSEEDDVSFGYNFLSTIYEGGNSGFNLLDHYGYAEYAHDFSERLTGTLQLADEFSQIGGHDYRNQFVARPGLSYMLAAWAETEVAYTFANSDYKVKPFIPRQNQSSNAHTLALTQYFYPANTNVELRLGYFHTWNDARGADWDYQSNGVLVGAIAPLFWEISAGVIYTHTWDDYSHLNSFDNFAHKRRDGVDILTLQLARPINQHLSVFVQYDYTNDASNVSAFRYVEQVVSGGVMWSW